jgi:hypothetical protein
MIAPFPDQYIQAAFRKNHPSGRRLPSYVLSACGAQLARQHERDEQIRSHGCPPVDHIAVCGKMSPFGGLVAFE